MRSSVAALVLLLGVVGATQVRVYDSVRDGKTVVTVHVGTGEVIYHDGFGYCKWGTC